MRSTARHRVESSRVGHRPGGSGPASSGPTPLVGEARRHCRDLGRVEIVQEPFTERLGDDEVGLGIEAGQEARPTP